MAYLAKFPRVATGLFSHWDSVIKVDQKVLDWVRSHKKAKPKGAVLNTVEEIAFSIRNSVKNGDNESLISKEAYAKLNSLLPHRERRTGGNGNNMGKAVLELGMTPLVSYPARPASLMYASPQFRVASGGEAFFPGSVVRKDDPEYDHIIFEHDKWRDILCWDEISSKGIFDEDFLRMAFNPKLTDISVISYAHVMLPKYRKRTDFVVDFIKRSRPKIHLEFGLGSKPSMRYAMEKLSGDKCDSWGMDEAECMAYLGARSTKEKDLVDAALKAAKDYSLKRICVHASKFVFSISRYSTEKEMGALNDACLAVGSKLFDSMPKRKGGLVSKKMGAYNLSLVPTFYTPHPRILTGLGDILAAVQAVRALS